MRNRTLTIETEEADYAPAARESKSNGVAQAGRSTVRARTLALPPTINYETLMAEARGSGFDMRCIGFVDGSTSTMIVVLQRSDGLWEAFVGLHHRLERLMLEPRTSFSFGGGTFLSGKNISGEPVSILIPEMNQENLGLTPTFNGAKIRRF